MCMTSIHFIYASTSGHTEYVVDILARYLEENAPAITVEKQRAEMAKGEDLLRGDVLILGSGTWNTGGIEGQLNMYLQRLLHERATNLDLQEKPMTCISLGDERYYYTTRCTEHLLRFIREHGAKIFIPPLVLVNEPYGQEEKIRKWGRKLIENIQQS